MSPSSSQDRHTTKSSQKSKKFIAVLLVLAAIVVIGSAIALNSNGGLRQNAGMTNMKTEPTNTNTEQQVNKTAVLELDPLRSNTKKDQTITLSIYIDTGGRVVNAVQANLAYPKDKYDFVSIDDTGSAFSITAEAKDEDGIIKIARGQIGGVSGKQLVAKVNLKQKTAVGQGNIFFADGTEAISANEPYDNILKSTTGATLTLGE